MNFCDTIEVCEYSWIRLILLAESRFLKCYLSRNLLCLYILITCTFSLNVFVGLVFKAAEFDLISHSMPVSCTSNWSMKALITFDWHLGTMNY